MGFVVALIAAAAANTAATHFPLRFLLLLPPLLLLPTLLLLPRAAGAPSRTPHAHSDYTNIGFGAAAATAAAAAAVPAAICAAPVSAAAAAGGPP